ncbi:MAG TPA: pyridoxamine 5'-phosphate oxidase family protein [Acidimicrobiales bacterium]|nr:pyridoxamine 5'-phosphate oxidase family protein [Acidimicrobiales bacterium]
MSERAIEVLSEAQCSDLLAAHHFGRIGVVSGGAPVILPVNYVFHDGRIAIRTERGTKLSAAALSQVAFEIDGVDEGERTGWSVLVRGTGYDVTDSVDEVSATLREAAVDTWAPGERDNWIRVEPTSITGRRISNGS